MRYLQPVAEYQEAGAVRDPITGMIFGYLRFTDTRSNKIFITLECLYGFSPAKTDGLKRIVKHRRQWELGIPDSQIPSLWQSWN